MRKTRNPRGIKKKVGVGDAREKSNEEKVIRPRFVKIKIDDIMEDLTQRVINEHGVEWGDVKCITKVDGITFEIPGLDDKLCNEVLHPYDCDSGCGSSGGGCLCGENRSHTGPHICKRCGEEWS